MTLGDILRNLLTDHDMTQKQLASDLGIGASTLGNYVQNNREPDYITIKRFADYFGVTTDYLLDHRSGKAESFKEDELLRVFRILTPDEQDLYIEQGKLFLTQNYKKAQSGDSVAANRKPRYKKQK